MQYNFPLLVPANTPKSSPVRVATPLNVGQLTKASVYFPWGCAGLVYVRILWYESQLYPTNRTEWLASNDLLIEFECQEDIVEGWTHFSAEGYNEDDFYPHTPIVSFVILPFGVSWTTLPLQIGA